MWTTAMSDKETSLDKRLRELLTNKFGYSETQGDMVDKLITQIKQSFDEAEYCSFIKYPTDGTHRMTGQEFYDRFWKLYETDLPKVIDSTIVRVQLDKVLKRAAGLEPSAHTKEGL